MARNKTALGALGLGCWLATMLLYSNTVTPFQRFEGTSLFVGTFAPASLACAALVSLAVAVGALRGRFMPARVLAGGCVLYVAGAALFAGASLGAAAWASANPDGGQFLPSLVAWMLAVCVGVSCVVSGLAWGRACKALDGRSALACVAGAALLAAALGAVGTLLCEEAFAALFCLEALLGAAVPFAMRLREPDCTAALTSEGLRERPLSQRLSAFADVAAPALAGLLAFAFVMGTMRSLIVESYGIHLGVLALCALILGAYVLRGRPQGSRVALRGLIPTLAVLQLASANVTAALWGGSPFDMAMIFLLYTLAALLTLSTLAAVAHAEEFPCDLVFSVALLLFCLASLAGLKAAEVMTAGQIRVSTTLVTTVYAFAMVLVGGLRGRLATPGARTHDRWDEVATGLGGRQRGAGAHGRDGRPGDEGAGDGGPVGDVAGGAGAGLCGWQADAGALGVGEAQAGAEGPADFDVRCAEVSERFHLTARERQILALLACGYDSAQISEELYISQNTVRSHIHNLCRKTGAANREELAGLVAKG